MIYRFAVLPCRTSPTDSSPRMDTLHIIWLALVQGLTEFLPISSSAHLILVPRLLGWPDQGLAFDVAVHLDTRP